MAKVLPRFEKGYPACKSVQDKWSTYSVNLMFGKNYHAMGQRQTSFDKKASFKYAIPDIFLIKINSLIRLLRRKAIESCSLKQKCQMNLAETSTQELLVRKQQEAGLQTTLSHTQAVDVNVTHTMHWWPSSQTHSYSIIILKYSSVEIQHISR